MGNEQNILSIIKDEYVKGIIDEDKNNILYHYYMQLSADNNCLTQKDFCKLVKISDSKILEEIFKMFSKKNKMSFKDLKKFYVSFKNQKFKYILFSFLFFGNQNKISKENYMNNSIPYLISEEKFQLFIDDNFVKEISVKGDKEKKQIDIVRKLFMKNSFPLIEEKFQDFIFIEDVPPSSKIQNQNLKDIKPFNYICDCLLEDNDSKSKNIDELEQMRIPFNNDNEAVSNGHMSFKSFEKIMNELRVDKKLINLIIKYLKFYTMKDYMNFEDFKYLMSNIYYPIKEGNKLKFLYKMIFALANEKSSTIEVKKLIKIIEIENKELIHSEKIELDSMSIEDEAIQRGIESYINYMYNLGLLPYLRYGIKPTSKKQKKELIMFILNNKSLKQYLNDNFDKNSSFYLIEKKFWKSLIKSEDSFPDKINNSKIAEEDPIFNMKFEENKNNEKQNVQHVKEKDKKEEKKEIINQDESQDKNQNVKIDIITNKKPKIGKLKANLIYGSDFVVVCGELYQKISEYFEIDYIIELRKSIKYLPLEIKENQETYKIEFYKEYFVKKEKAKDNIIAYIVDFYPIKILQFPLSELIQLAEKEIENLNIRGEKEEKKIKNEKSNNNKGKNKSELYHEELKKVETLKANKIIGQSKYDQKMDLLLKKYNDIISNENTERIETTKLKKKEFLGIFKRKYNDIIINNKLLIKKDTRYRTGEELKDIIIKNNSSLNNNNFEILYSTFNKLFYEPLMKENFIINDVEDFVFVIIDIKNPVGETNLFILEKNEKEGNYNKYSEYENTEIITETELKRLKKNEKEKEKKQKKQKKAKIEEKSIEKEQKEKEKTKKNKEEEITPPFGITNFGNTCYFNAVNQIFFNLPILQKLFTNPKFSYFINKKNKFGYKGDFIKAFISLYQIYPSKITEKAHNLKVLVGKFNSNFDNNMQQDANEYLNFVIESLHEEINLKSSKRYIITKDDNYKYNSENELGDIAWANNLRRNASFIDSIFMFQLKSNLTCRKCNTKKVNFETNYVFDMPLSLCRMITIEINLYRLPFKYKIYYDKINKDFQEYRKINENKSITENLISYYSEKLNNDEKRQHLVKVCFEFEFERSKTISDLSSLIRNISLFELEPEKYDILNENEEISEYRIDHFSELITYSTISNKLIKPDEILDKYADKNDKVYLDIYEVLNTKGLSFLNILKEEQNLTKNLNIFSYKIKTKLIKGLETMNDINYFNEKDTNSNNKYINMLSLNDKLTNFPETIFFSGKLSKHEANGKLIKIEYPIPIVHYHRDTKQGNANIFLDFYHTNLADIPQQFIVFNNGKINQITAKSLYNYVWNLNSLYMNHPNKKIDDFWWNLETDTNPEIYVKKCYPFVLRLVRRKPHSKHSYECAKCQWYKFCIGCILYPDDKEILEIYSDCMIFVDWCNSFLKEEVESCNFEKKNFSNEEITKCIELLYRDNKNKIYQSIDDCFNLFFEKELLEDPLYCRVCEGLENFSKEYEINKFPYVLILSLKRFKYNENNHFKLKQLITYPLYDFILNNKKYDLYGIVYHYGELIGGHYVSVIKSNNKWMMCDDKKVFEIEEDKVMNSNAYILFYISKDSINENSYYNNLKLLMDNIPDKKKKNDPLFINCYNFFRGEPVKTPYGEAYVLEDYLENFTTYENKNDNNKNKINENKKNGMIKIKFDFGIGTVNIKNVKKQIMEDN